MQNSYQPGVNPTGLGTIHMWQTEPYLMRYIDSDEYANIEAGPSNFVPLYTTYMAQPFTNPSGGSSEATAYAKHTNTFTEENAAPVSNFYCSHVPRVTESVFDVGRPGSPHPQGSRSVRRPCVRSSSSRYAFGREIGSISRVFQPVKELWVVSANPVSYGGAPWSN